MPTKSDEKQQKFCPFLPPMPVRTALSPQPQLSWVACQKDACEMYDAGACACCLKAKVTVDMGHKEVKVGVQLHSLQELREAQL